jgi:hypothetical protein
MGGSAGSLISAGLSVAGALGQGSTDNQVNTNIPIGEMNSILDKSLGNALDYSQNYTSQATDAQTQYLQQAMNALTKAGNQLTDSFNQSQGLQQPYRVAGYNALDSYEDTLGMKRPTIGNAAVAQALNDQAVTQGKYRDLQSGQSQLNQLYDYGSNTDMSQLGNAPTLDLLSKNMTDDQIDSYLQKHTSKTLFGQNPTPTLAYTGYGATGITRGDHTLGYLTAGGIAPDVGSATYDNGDARVPHTGASYYGDYADMFGNAQFQHAGAMGAAQQYMPQAQSLFGQQQQNYNSLNQYLSGTYTPTQQNIANAASAGLFNAPTMQKVGY